jgi:hypothetical protein
VTALAGALRERHLGLIVSALLLLSLGAFVAETYAVLDMTVVLSFVALPGVILAAGIVGWAARGPHPALYRRVLLGLGVGAVATATYDLVRLLAQTVLPLDFNAFAIHARFGELIIDQPRTTLAAQVVGWAYHISNGLTFAICYVLVAGRARWWYGLAYGTVLEGLMVTMYPSAFGVSRGDEAFLTISFIGHATYGATVGLLAQRYNEPAPAFFGPLAAGRREGG